MLYCHTVTTASTTQHCRTRYSTSKKSRSEQVPNMQMYTGCLQQSPIWLQFENPEGDLALVAFVSAASGNSNTTNHTTQQ